ncbi:MAG: pyruvate, phosphate dikinase [Pyrinomonadaceae bacterium MAG19_C2-C3]|nr:pyruvate, phosphate dikinase [Pyrinomonadaceae bacterium MAG19_C2-C3]
MQTTIKPERYVFSFGNGTAEGNGEMKDVIGGKGAGLAEMTNAGLPVPPGFTISTAACGIYEREGRLSEEVEQEAETALRCLEDLRDERLGDEVRPLLVSVRSGAKFSMPGMMDTILNLGLNDCTVEALAQRTANNRFAWDSYRRFIQMFGDVVLGVEKREFETALAELKRRCRVEEDTALTETNLRELVELYKRIVTTHSGSAFPQEPREQLRQARDAVFRSWNNDRAVHYRRINNISGALGTAVNVQTMVFGNMGETSGTGVGFTRNPATGEREFYGEFLVNAQGEDVVAGIRTPLPLTRLRDVMPDVYEQLKEITARLEHHYRDVQDFEFTIQEGKLFMLQTRNGKRTGLAAVRIACEMVDEGLLTPREALMRIEPNLLDQLLHPMFDPRARLKFPTVARGLAASPGAATGTIVFTAAEAVARGHKGERVVLVREETTPDDIAGMEAAQGFLTARGGQTSHAAVVGRQMGKPAVVGCAALHIDEAEGVLKIAGISTVAEEIILSKGDEISLDGTTGEVMTGRVPTASSEILRVVSGEMRAGDSEVYGMFARVLEWADEVKRLDVRANADIPRDAAVARAFGARGIGLCRTEHMFFAAERLPHVQSMILAAARGREGLMKLAEVEQRQASSTIEKLAAERELVRARYGEQIDNYVGALRNLLPMQRADFAELFRAMSGYPVTIRLLDPPLHEFLPNRDNLVGQLSDARADGRHRWAEELEAMLTNIEQLAEVNPMLGHRGVRLGITYPEITEMQVRAICEAACLTAAENFDPQPEIMVPLVGTTNELALQRRTIERTVEQVFSECDRRVPYTIGTMIELPRAALLAGEIAQHADFFSFGTNDLTQTTYGLSRDDAGSVITAYQRLGVYEQDPFVVLDREGVGQLLQLGTERGRATRPNLKVGICGEHGGEPSSIEFCHNLNFDYVSCSPYRVPIARLAAARAVLASES